MLYLKVIAFIDLYDTLVEGQVLKIDVKCGTLGRKFLWPAVRQPGV